MVLLHRTYIRRSLTPFPHATLPSSLRSTDINDKVLRFIEKFGGNVESVERQHSWVEQQTDFLREIRDWDEDKLMKKAEESNAKWIKELDAFMTAEGRKEL